jgi:glycosyltransferase involved in cell wall biosynthesis
LTDYWHLCRTLRTRFEEDPMNVVILNDSASVNGGAAKVALEEARALASVGHQVYLVCGVGPVAQELDDHENLMVHCVGSYDILTDPNRLRAMARGWWNPVSGKYVEDLLDSLSPRNTVVHVHNFSKSLSSSVMRAALDRRFALIITLHDFQLACPTGNLFLHNKQQKCTLQPMSTACIRTNCDQRSYQHKLWRVGRQAVQNRFGQIPAGAKHFIYHSQTARDLLRKYLPSDAAFYGLPIAIEMDYVPPADVFVNDKFIFLGRLVREKGPELFARAAAAEQVPCQFVGEGIARAAIARANPDAILSGWMSHRDCMHALRSARALVFPSLWYETLGMVVLEAAALGVPSIVPDSCAARESVVDGVTGFYFRSGDESDLRAKIAKLKDPEVAARMGKAAHERFWTPPGWSIESHRQRLESIYSQVLAKHAATHDTAAFLKGSIQDYVHT